MVELKYFHFFFWFNCCQNQSNGHYKQTFLDKFRHFCTKIDIIKQQTTRVFAHHFPLDNLIFFDWLTSFSLFLHWKFDWENRKINNIGNNCLVSVDGTDFALAWGSNQQRLSCYKLKGKPGLQYKVAVCLRTSDIVWISGPHFPRFYNDLQIFWMGLINMFDERKMWMGRWLYGWIFA